MEQYPAIAVERGLNNYRTPFCPTWLLRAFSQKRTGCSLSPCVTVVSKACRMAVRSITRWSTARLLCSSLVQKISPIYGLEKRLVGEITSHLKGESDDENANREACRSGSSCSAVRSRRYVDYFPARPCRLFRDQFRGTNWFRHRARRAQLERLRTRFSGKRQLYRQHESL